MARGSVSDLRYLPGAWRLGRKPDLVQVLQAEGVSLRQRGRYFWACCPFHSEKTPSFKVAPERQQFYCFGCHKHGDVITFIQKFRGLSFKEALRYLGIGTDPLTSVRQAEIERQRRKHELHRGFQVWERGYHMELCHMYRCLQVAKWNCKTTEDVENLSPWYHLESAWIRQLDILEEGTEEEKYSLWREVQRNA